MELAVRMAERSVGLTAPNPPVGVIIVKDGQILSRGWTQIGGSPHAEIHAINQVRNKSLLNGSTMYSTLEPCSHRGKNPPCIDTIIKYKFKNIVISQKDKNPLVNGNGIKKLRSKGIRVTQTNFNNYINKFNNIFFHSINKKKPYLCLKIASTADGKIATKTRDSKWITGKYSRMMGHYLRSKNDCILVGRGTVEKDNPSLNCRLSGLDHTSPDIFILDTNLNLSLNSRIFKLKNRKISIFHNCSNFNKKKYKNITLIRLNDNPGMLDIRKIIKLISGKGYHRILVEGGSQISTSLLKNNLIDKIYWFRASKVIGGEGIGAISNLNIRKMNLVKRFKLENSLRVEDDIMDIYTRG
jgi:diaminohydroxyphosphoribosylaminopyrimidine deaminase/5-amino-6-(5-phosphoribosylamino)uracil reductase